MIESVNNVYELAELRAISQLKKIVDSRMQQLSRKFPYPCMKTLRRWTVEGRFQLIKCADKAWSVIKGDSSYLAKLAAGHGHLHILKWMHKHKLLTSWDVNYEGKGQVVRAALVYGDSEVIDWLHDTYGPLRLGPVYQYSLPLIARKSHSLSHTFYYLRRHGRRFTFREENRMRRLGWDCYL